MSKVTAVYKMIQRSAFFAFICIAMSAGGLANTQALAQNNSAMLSVNTNIEQYQANVLQKVVSVDFEDVTLEAGLKRVASKVGLKLVYSKQLIPVNKRVSLHVNNMELEKVLWHLLEGTGLRFAISSSDHLVLMKSNIQKTSNKSIQTSSITGQVTDAQTGELMPGANIRLAGTTKGVSTSENGRYILDDIESGEHTFVASFIGYEPQGKTVEVMEDQTTTVNFELINLVSEMEEMVVTGYVIIEKRKLTSSITTLSEDELGSETESSIDKMLQGKAPGVSVIESSGAVGSVPVVRIRGNSTLTGNAQPLWVLDGVVLEDPVPLSPAEINSPNAVNRIGNSISGINPADIASINILKDASATAIYGVKAADGVIVLTTKSGHKGDLRVNFQSRVGMSEPLSYDRFNLMNSKERIDIEEYYFNLEGEQYYNADANVNSVGLAGAYARYKNRELETWEDFQAAVREAETYNTDWFDVLYRNSISNYNNISFSGGSDKNTYYASFSATNQEGSDILTNNERYTGSVKLNFDLRNDLNLEVYLSGNSRERTSYPRSLVPAGISNFTRPTPQPFQYALNTSRTFPLRKSGDYYMYRGHDDFYTFNIMNEYNNSDQTNKTNELTSRATVNWNILNNLAVRGIFGYSLSNTQNETYYTAQTNQVAGVRRSNFGEPVPGNSNLPRGGVIFSKNDFRNYYQSRFSLNYLPIQTDKHNVELLGGGEYR